MKADKTIVAAAAVFVFLHAIALMSGFLAPYPFEEQHRDSAFRAPTSIHFIDETGRFHLQPFVYSGAVSQRHAIHFFVLRYQYRFLNIPSGRHLFGVEGGANIFLIGTDGFGRDQFSRLLEGSRVSLAAGWIATLLSLGLGVTLGTIAGFFGGWVDELIMRMGEASLSLPWLYLLLAARAFLPLNLRPASGYLVVITVVGILGWAQPARLIRGVSLIARQRGYVAAAKAFGASNSYLVRVHLLPETLSVAVTQAAILMPRYIIAELTLSFLGLGIDEPLPSWGNLLAGVQQYSVLSSSWWMLLPAFGPVAVALSCFAMSDAMLASRRPVPV